MPHEPWESGSVPEVQSECSCAAQQGGEPVETGTSPAAQLGSACTFIVSAEHQPEQDEDRRQR